MQNLSEISAAFLQWEEEEGLLGVLHNGFPIYLLIRPQIYEAVLLGTDPIELMTKDTGQTKVQLNYLKLGRQVISFFVNFRKLFRELLVISHTENRRFDGHNYYDIYFDRITDTLDISVCIVEFPKIGLYHYSENHRNEKVIKGDLFYVLERIMKSGFDSKLLAVQTREIVDKYSVFYQRVFRRSLDDNTLEGLFYKKFERNLRRIGVYERLLRFSKPRTLMLKSSYSPKSLILIFLARKLGIRSLEVQHGHIYPYHIGYLRTRNQNSLFPDHIFLWSEHYKKTLLSNGWNEKQMTVTGDFTQLSQLNTKDRGDLSEALMDFIERHETIITVIGQHSINEVFVRYLLEIRKLPKDAGIIFKFHPKFAKQQQAFFEKHLGLNDNLFYLSEGNIRLCFEKSNLVVGVYSTAVIEAIELKKPVHLIDCPQAEIFQDFVDGGLLLKSRSVQESIKLLKSMPDAKTQPPIGQDFDEHWRKKQDIL
ncbi:capsular polysaccharide export protein, LipB/KpsS family [Robiginitalea sp. IMCC43444]|uniref:capsular polysaccharide export protein, LipB/KpsS family n=1 Tax=Robiginitalea sp. IMCC43444 TaxID=3459121 RepID=UPI0040425859